MRPKATLYMKADCHLCEATLADLERLQARHPHTLELAVELRDTQHLAAIMQKVRGMGDILDIRRATAIRKEPRLK